MRTKERGLLTTADAFTIAGLETDLRQRAHGGSVLSSFGCPACTRLGKELGRWIAAHAASEKQLDELEKARCR
jgi:hypothetical protein